MLKSILVGLDGSPHSQVAVEMGLRWATASDALLVGIGVIDTPTIRASRGPAEQADQRVADNRRRVEQFLERFALQCTEAKVACKLLEDVGLPADQIALQAHRYDMVLLGRRTYFQLETHDGPDETLLQVLKHSPRPVVTVPNSVRPGRCSVVAYDGSPQSARAVQAFQALGLHAGREVFVVTVGKDRREAAGCAARAVDFLTLHNVKAHARPVRSDASPGEVLRSQAWEMDAGLIVMGAYGQPAWREFAFGSVTRALLKEGPVPLFLSS
jgi:nucleotide-binding universal stress UspA family protein